MDPLTLTYIVIVAVMGITLLAIIGLARHKDKPSTPPPTVRYSPGYGASGYTPGPLSGTPGPLSGTPGPLSGTPGPLGYGPRPGTPPPAMPPKTPPKTAPAPKHETKAKAAPRMSSKVTIYEYKNTAPSRLCKYCDGENDTSASRCCICGQVIS